MNTFDDNRFQNGEQENILENGFAEAAETNEVPEAKPAYTEWETSSYIREYSAGSENVEPVQEIYEPVYTEASDTFTFDEEEPTNEYNGALINETVKKKGIKKYVAVIVAASVVNLAVLGGMFFVGYKMGTQKDDVSPQAQSEAQSKENVLGILNEDSKAENTAGAKNTVVQGEELSTVEISKKVGPAVVGITSKVESAASFFGGSAYAEGTGSGIIITGDGYIVTNYHVIEGATAVSVTLNTGSEYEAKVIGADSRTDLAVLKISPNEQLTVAELGDSSTVEVGERAIAIGNPLGMEFFGSTTQGIISAKNRTITVDNKTMSVLQTDAAINEGNSGGALVNAYGKVIGINAVKISSSTVEGMGFAIPISEAKPILTDLIEHGYVKGRPVIGISSRDVTEYMAQRQNWPMGVQVMEVMVGTGAEIAGLRQGDIITKADGKEVGTVDELNKIKNGHKPGESLQLEVYKYETGLKTNVSVRLGEERPE